MKKNMFDLNDLYYFSKIVEHGSFNGAAAVLGVANSVLSEHMSRLESSLGVRLIQRTTRKIHITEIGSRVYDHCRTMGEEARLAREVAETATEKVGGTLRFVCGALLAERIVGPVLSEFLLLNREMHVVFDVSNMPIDVINDNYDIAFRASQNTKDSTLIVRTLADIEVMLCAAPDLVRLKGRPRSPRELANFDTVACADDCGHYQWVFTKSGKTHTVRLQPRILSRSASVVLDTVMSGAVIGMVPRFLGLSAQRANTVVELLPEWRPAKWVFQAVYASRQGLQPAARLFLKYLAERLPHVAGPHLQGIVPIAPASPSPTTRLEDPVASFSPSDSPRRLTRG